MTRAFVPWAIALLVCGLAAPISAATPSPSTPLPLDPGLRLTVLDNGLTCYVRENPFPAGQAEVRLVVNVGSIVEEDSQRGLAHFVEHMAFRATELYSAAQLRDFISSLGLRTGSHANAATRFDETIYQLSLPTSDPEIFEKGLRILRSWATGLSFKTPQVERERKVILAEALEKRTASTRLAEQNLGVLFAGSRYPERIPIGEEEVVRRVSGEELRRFYRRWYRPELMAVIAVGDFDGAQVETWIHRHFGELPAPERELERRLFQVPDHAEPRFAVLVDPEIPHSMVNVTYKRDPYPLRTVGDYRRHLLELLFHRSMNARLDLRAQDPDAPFLTALSREAGSVRTKSVTSLSALTSPGRLPEALEGLLTEVERIRRYGFSPSEVARHRAALLAAMEGAHRQRDRTEHRLLVDELRDHFLARRAVPGIAHEVALARELLPGIAGGELSARVSGWMDGENCVVLGRVRDPGEKVSVAEMSVLFTAVREKKIPPLSPRPARSPLVAEPPPPAAIVARREMPSLGMTRWTLENGVRVLLKPTGSKSDRVLLSAWKPGGHSLLDPADVPVATQIGSVLERSGVSGVPRAELDAILGGRHVRATPYVDELFEGFSGESSPRDLDLLLQMIYLRTTAPRVEPDAFEVHRSHLRAVVAGRRADPAAILENAVLRTASGDHPRRRPLSLEQVEALDWTRGLEIYRQRFRDATDFTFLLVGDVDLAAVERWVRIYLGNLPADGGGEGWRDPGVQWYGGGPRRVVVHAGEVPKGRVSLGFGGPLRWDRQEIEVLKTLALILQRGLERRLRIELGATYAVDVSTRTRRLPQPTYHLQIHFECAVEVVDALIAEALTVVGRLRTEEVDGQELAHLVRARQNQRQLELTSDRFWLEAVSSSYRRGEDPRQVLRFERRVEEVSPTTLRWIARRYLDLEQVLQVLVLPAESS